MRFSLFHNLLRLCLRRISYNLHDNLRIQGLGQEIERMANLMLGDNYLTSLQFSEESRTIKRDGGSMSIDRSPGDVIC